MDFVINGSGELIRYCGTLTEVKVPNSVNRIGDGALAYCESLKKLIIPKTVTFIGQSAFYDCKMLQSLILPEGIEVDSRMLNGCPSSLKIKYY